MGRDSLFEQFSANSLAHLYTSLLSLWEADSAGGSGWEDPRGQVGSPRHFPLASAAERERTGRGHHDRGPMGNDSSA